MNEQFDEASTRYRIGAVARLTGINPIALDENCIDLENRGANLEADALVIEQESLLEDTASRVIDYWLGRSKAAHAVVVYRYASQAALQRLPHSRCSALRAPVDLPALQAHCLLMMDSISMAPGSTARLR